MVTISMSFTDLSCGMLKYKNATIYYVLRLTICFEGDQKLANKNRSKKLKTRIELLEKELLQLKGRERREARTEYLNLLKSCGKEFGLDEPIYIRRF